MATEAPVGSHRQGKGAARGRSRLAALADAPWQVLSWMLPGSANRVEVRIVALRRSGHHAVINWLLNQIDGRYVFLNNCRAASNPFLSCHRSDSQYKALLSPHGHMWWRLEAAGWHSKRDFLLHSYEDQTPAMVATSHAESNRERWVGHSDTRFDLLVLRDPYNMLASRLRWCEGTGYWQPPLRSLFEARAMWTAQAREYLGETNYLSNRINVSYNRWFVDRAYRQALAETLGVKWTDRGIEQVARWGPTVWGDSFDGLTFDGRASQMKVLERWQTYAANPLFRRLCDHEELATLSERVYGRLQGVERLLD